MRLSIGAVGMEFFNTNGPAGKEYVKKTKAAYTKRIFKKFGKAAQLVCDIATFDFDKKIDAPTYIIRPEHDELVPYTDATRYAVEERNIFGNLKVEIVNDQYDRHSLPILHGQRMAEKIIKQYENWKALS
jgi:hypothetical protein